MWSLAQRDRRRFATAVAVGAVVASFAVPVGPPASAAADAVDTGDLAVIARIVNARAAWSAGYTGKGVDVALIDTGVAAVPGLTSGNVVHGPDLSFDSVHPDVRYQDTYGHGTHLASIIAGRDQAKTPAGYAQQTSFTGIAPDARIVSLKVGVSDGAVDVSQVIAAINWVVENRNRNGLNIRVLNLSYGTDGGQNYLTDPLAYAVERAWLAGIVVVVAGGNDGTAGQDLADPARSPSVIAVGASDPRGTENRGDDVVPAFADRGTLLRHVDVVAPGTHVLGLRVPQGHADQSFPSAVVDQRYFRGSGTSQAAAVVSGVAALMLQRNPQLSPDEVKAVLSLSANQLTLGTLLNSGAGTVDARAAIALVPVPSLLDGLLNLGQLVMTEVNRLKHLASPGTGTGTLDGARGSSVLSRNGVELSGEQDIFGAPWLAAAWAAAARDGTTWSQGFWNTERWTGTSWVPGSPQRWQAADWDDVLWFGERDDDGWVSRTWIAGGWDSRTWIGSGWESRTWVGSCWSMNGWE